MRRRQQFGFDPLSLRGIDRSVVDELRQRLLVEMLQLASAACPEMAAGRRDMMRARLDRPILRHAVARRGERNMTPARGDSITLCGNAQDLFTSVHKQVA